MKKANITFLLIGLTLVSGCARDIDSGTYAESHVGRAVSTYYGVVLEVRNVVVKGGESLEDNATGALIGGVAGGVAGNMFGGGRGRTATTTLGALGGMAAGAYAQNRMKQQSALEYTVRLEGGRILTVVQGKEVVCQPGQKVLVSVDPSGRSRIRPTFN